MCAETISMVAGASHQPEPPSQVTSSHEKPLQDFMCTHLRGHAMSFLQSLGNESAVYEVVWECNRVAFLTEVK